ncbi:MAG: T9SS type A sorting domain-containing protein, partial [Candidatus Symbiothrix sp.]|nr:T9SS type A sorting domain-containing protein [Candidatus Symbiothrix sp.]
HVFSSDAIYGNPSEPYRIVTGTTGINSPGNEKVNIYPNPVSATLFINHPWEKIDVLEISDLIGRRIILETGFTKQSVNVSGLVKGVYILKLRKGGQIFVEKFTKK